MQRCPECGEPVQKGQTHCFACGSDFVISPARPRFLQRNIIFVALIISGCIIAALLAILITQPKAKSTINESDSGTKIPSKVTAKDSALKIDRSVASVKTKKVMPTDDIETLNQDLANLEEKITNLEKISQTQEFTKDEKDALRFARTLHNEMKSLLLKIKDTKDEKEVRRLIRQFRLKQNDVNQFLFLLKNHLK